MPVTLEPDVREHAGPAAVPVQKRVNPDRPVVKPHSLLHERFPPCFPEDEVIEKSLKLHLDVVPVTAEVKALLAELTSPHRMRFTCRLWLFHRAQGLMALLWKSRPNCSQ